MVRGKGREREREREVAESILTLTRIKRICSAYTHCVSFLDNYTLPEMRISFMKSCLAMKE